MPFSIRPIRLHFAPCCCLSYSQSKHRLYRDYNRPTSICLRGDLGNRDRAHRSDLDMAELPVCPCHHSRQCRTALRSAGLCTSPATVRQAHHASSLHTALPREVFNARSRRRPVEMPVQLLDRRERHSTTLPRISALTRSHGSWTSVLASKMLCRPL